MNNISLLSPNLIGKIAAGEVVERPASVVKELLENAIDADADSITLKIINGGLKEITVEDNGSGIRADELELAFTQHATSKIKSLEDLNNIISMGFRGEALASIAAVADIEVTTFHVDSNPAKAKLANSVFLNKEDFPRPQGTTVSVFDVFRHVPARKKFLSSDQTEYKHIYNIFISLSLAHPEISFKLIKDGKEVRFLKKTDVKKRIIDVLGSELESKLIAVNYDSPEIKLTGFIGHPNIANDHNPKQYIFLNKRPIQEKTVYVAVRDGFGTTIPKDRKPSYFLYLSIDPQKVDVNVHPRKSEVKFSNSTEIYKAVKNSVEKALSQHLKSTFTNTAKVFVPENTVFNPVRQETNNSYSARADYSSKGAYGQSRSKDKISVNKSLEFTKSLFSDQSKTFESQSNFSNFNDQYLFKGQIFTTYLIFEKETEMIIIDQHAADERVNYEKLEQSLQTNSQISVQPLLLPYEFEIPSELTEVFLSKLNELKQLGLEILHNDNNNFKLTSVPAFMKNFNNESLINNIIEDLSGENSNLKLEQILDRLISTIACHSSIKAGDRIDREQANKIIKDLFETRLPYSCPHGRPIVWRLSKMDLMKNFERTY